MRMTTSLLTLGLLAGISALAQPVGFSYSFDNRTFEFQDGRTVKGSPYTATAVSTSTQTLGDGTHITRTSQSQLARDSEGRTRREQGVDNVGPWTTKDQHIVFINDPVAQVRYTIRPDSQTGSKANTSAPSAEAELKLKRSMEELAKLKQSMEEAQRNGQASSSREEGTVHVLQARKAAEAGAQGFTTFRRGDDGAVWVAGNGVAAGGVAGAAGRSVTISDRDSGGPITVVLGGAEKGEAKVEDLGEKIIEGVRAKGHRESRTIPVGEIGNDRPIEVSSESWYSDELRMVVYSKRSDPRVGETEYRLTNISRAEPPSSLFDVPAGVTIREEGKRRD